LLTEDTVLIPNPDPNVAVFGFLFDYWLMGIVSCCALCAGIFGHLFVNLALRFISPLVVSVFVLLEPALGSLFGWLAGYQSRPS